MFEALATAVKDLGEPCRDRDDLIELLAVRDRLEAHVAASVAEFERSEQWAIADGATSVVQWLGFHGRLGRDDAKRLTTIGRCAHRFPVVAQAFETGELSAAQVRVIAGHIPPDAQDLFAVHEPELVPTLVA